MYRSGDIFWKVVISRGAVSDKGKPCRSTKKKGHRHHPHGNGRPPGGDRAHGVCRSGMITSTNEKYRKADAVSRKKHAIRKTPYAHLDFTMRLTPERAWNAYVREPLCISVRFFARPHGLPESTWRRAPGRGAVDAELKTATTDNEREVSHQAVIPEGDGLLEDPARGRPRGRGHRQLNPQTSAER